MLTGKFFSLPLGFLSLAARFGLGFQPCLFFCFQAGLLLCFAAGTLLLSLATVFLGQQTLLLSPLAFLLCLLAGCFGHLPFLHRLAVHFLSLVLRGLCLQAHFFGNPAALFLLFQAGFSLSLATGIFRLGQAASLLRLQARCFFGLAQGLAFCLQTCLLLGCLATILLDEPPFLRHSEPLFFCLAEVFLSQQALLLGTLPFLLGLAIAFLGLPAFFLGFAMSLLCHEAFLLHFLPGLLRFSLALSLFSLALFLLGLAAGSFLLGLAAGGFRLLAGSFLRLALGLLLGCLATGLFGHALFLLSLAAGFFLSQAAGTLLAGHEEILLSLLVRFLRADSLGFCQLAFFLGLPALLHGLAVHFLSLVLGRLCLQTRLLGNLAAFLLGFQALFLLGLAALCLFLSQAAGFLHLQAGLLLSFQAGFTLCLEARFFFQCGAAGLLNAETFGLGQAAGLFGHLALLLSLLAFFLSFVIIFLSFPAFLHGLAVSLFSLVTHGFNFLASLLLGGLSLSVFDFALFLLYQTESSLLLGVAAGFFCLPSGSLLGQTHDFFRLAAGGFLRFKARFLNSSVEGFLLSGAALTFFLSLAAILLGLLAFGFGVAVFFLGLQALRFGLAALFHGLAVHFLSLALGLESFLLSYFCRLAPLIFLFHPGFGSSLAADFFLLSQAAGFLCFLSGLFFGLAASDFHLFQASLHFSLAAGILFFGPAALFFLCLAAFFRLGLAAGILFLRQSAVLLSLLAFRLCLAEQILGSLVLLHRLAVGFFGLQSRRFRLALGLLGMESCSRSFIPAAHFCLLLLGGAGQIAPEFSHGRRIRGKHIPQPTTTSQSRQQAHRQQPLRG